MAEVATTPLSITNGRSQERQRAETTSFSSLVRGKQLISHRAAGT